MARMIRWKYVLRCLMDHLNHSSVDAHFDDAIYIVVNTDFHEWRRTALHHITACFCYLKTTKLISRVPCYPYHFAHRKFIVPFYTIFVRNHAVCSCREMSIGHFHMSFHMEWYLWFVSVAAWYRNLNSFNGYF